MKSVANIDPIAVTLQRTCMSLLAFGLAKADDLGLVADSPIGNGELPLLGALTWYQRFDPGYDDVEEHRVVYPIP
jgi:hypothetical protein